jgi:uroporphyrin-III C-methyltransferase
MHAASLRSKFMALNLPDLPAFLPGTVWLAGAGPGDPGLLSLHALNGLQQADVIVHDALVSQYILALVSDPAERLEFAGKRGGRPSAKQSDISGRLVELAQAGKRVLRLKGGDPFVFGRGGEEALVLAREQIPFRIIPGITAGVGGLAYAGIPTTQRNVNTVVSFITAHTMSGAPDDLNWRALAEASPVLIFYMALKQMPAITRHLIAAGRSPDEPVAMISKATTAEQQSLITTLARAVDDCAAAKLEAPIIVAVGDVVLLQESLGWFDPKELANGAATAFPIRR